MEFDNAPLNNTLNSDRVAEYLQVHNLPDDLKPSFKILNPSQIEILLDDNARSHLPVDSVRRGVSLSFKPQMFANDAHIDNIHDIGIEYIRKGHLEAFPKIFVEAHNNSGTIANEMTITISNDLFSRRTGALATQVPAGAIMARNVPDDLRVSYAFVDDNVVRVRLEGSAHAHSHRDDLDNIRFDFNADIMRSGIAPDSLEGVSINFGDKITLVPHRQDFTEGVLLDDGSMANTVTLEIQGGGELNYTEKSFAFASKIDQDTVYGILDSRDKFLRLGAERKNIPISPDLYFKKDAAFMHHVASAINDGWNGTTLANGDVVFASVVNDGVGRLAIVLLKDAASTGAIPFESGNSNNRYANDNNVSLSDRSIRMPLKYDDFKDHIQFENVPLGLTPQFNAIDTKHIEIVLKGQASNHQIVDSIQDMKVTISDDVIRGALFVEEVDDLSVQFVEKIELKDGQSFKRVR